MGKNSSKLILKAKNQQNPQSIYPKNQQNSKNANQKKFTNIGRN